MSLQGDEIAEQRPTYRRQSTAERRQISIRAFKSSGSLYRLKEQKGTLEAAAEVSATARFLQTLLLILECGSPFTQVLLSLSLTMANFATALLCMMEHIPSIARASLWGCPEMQVEVTHRTNHR